jgi:hypothetical protein
MWFILVALRFLKNNSNFQHLSIECTYYILEILNYLETMVNLKIKLLNLSYGFFINPKVFTRWKEMNALNHKM